MPLTPGTRLGAYEILSALGAGGMGEVYRARDTKLNRAAALKVTPDTFALDPDRISRFQREAQVLASLNHPHTEAIYGFEDSRAIHALGLELVEGETLADSPSDAFRRPQNVCAVLGRVQAHRPAARAPSAAWTRPARGAGSAFADGRPMRAFAG